MPDNDPTAQPERTEPPGKLRTWWHPLLVRLLGHVLGDACEILDEVNVGQLPLRLDVVLIRRRGKRLPPQARTQLHALSTRLNRFTLLELKSPADALDRTDLDRLLACAHLFRAQQKHPLKASEISLLMLAPKLTRAFEADLRRTAFQRKSDGPGVHRIQGTAFKTWLIETDRFTVAGEPVLTWFSHLVLRDPRGIIREQNQHGQAGIVNYTVQQIWQFHTAGEEFSMRHAKTELLDETLEKLAEEMLAILPAERRMEGLSPEKRLEGLTPEERIEGLSPEEILKGLSKEQQQRMYEFLDRQSPATRTRRTRRQK